MLGAMQLVICSCHVAMDVLIKSSIRCTRILCTLSFRPFNKEPSSDMQMVNLSKIVRRYSERKIVLLNTAERL